MTGKAFSALRSTQGQAAYMAVGQVLITLITIVTGLAVARYLVPADYGRFIYYVKIFGVLRLVAALGMTGLVIYEVARMRARAGALEESFLPHLILRLVTLGVLVVLPLVVGGIRHDTLLIITVLTAAAALLMDYFLGVLQGLALVPQTIGVLLVQPVIYGVLVLVIGIAKAPTVYLFWAQLISFLFGLGLAVLWMRPHVRWGGLSSLRGIMWRPWLTKALRIAGGFYAIAIFLTIFGTYATLLLGSTGQYEDAANFTIPLNTVALIPGVFSFALTTVYYPRLVQQQSRGEVGEARQTFQEYFMLSGVITVFVTVCLMAFPTIFLHLLYGNLYVSSATYLIVLAPTVMLSTLGTGLLWAVAAQGRMKAALVSVAIPTVALVATLKFISLYQLPEQILFWFAAVYTVAGGLMFIWQYRMIGYSLRGAAFTILQYAALALVAIGATRAIFADISRNTIAVLIVLGIACTGYAGLLLRKEYGIAVLARRRTRSVIAFGAFILGSTLAGSSVVSAQSQTGQDIVVLTSPNLEEVTAGGEGTAWLLYHSPEQGPTKPKLAVRLERRTSDGSAEALVYGAPANSGYVPAIPSDDRLDLEIEGISPALKIIAPDGWWVRDGMVNYNLSITVYGQVPAMWGTTLDVKGPYTDWTSLLAPDTPNAQIYTMDTNSDGLPDWDWRTMLPDFPNRGDYRTNYAERKCDSPLTVDAGVSPQWPYVAFDGGFEQQTGIFRPPIVVDWATGQIQYFSELVTVRNQNCSYSLYSIERVLPGRLNSPNFETPFAFYDLSGEGFGYPNLLLRTQRTVEDEPYQPSINPETQNIRYSWRNAVGDSDWDYKVDVLGQHRYTDETPIAGGLATIDAPAYEAFPEWVIDRDWPAVAFVAAEQSRYRSSEGIYDWSLLGLTDDYFFGWHGEPDLSQFNDIRVGIRGEYRLNSVHRPETYFSPVDNRLHLKWAEHGIWRLDGRQIVRVSNLDGDEFIDVWSREEMDITVDEDARTVAMANPEPVAEPTVTASSGAEADGGEPLVIEALYALDGHLLHTDGTNLSLVASNYETALFEALPPTDHDTWEVHRAQLAPYQFQRRDPTNLRAWLDTFPGSRSDISGATLAHVRATADGFRFQLTLRSGYRVAGPDLLGLDGLPAGEYVVENHAGAFTVAPLLPAKVSLSVARPAELGAAAPARIVVENTGSADAPGLTLIVEVVLSDGSVMELVRDPVDALAGQATPVLIRIPYSVGHNAGLHTRLEDAEGQVVTVLDPLPLAVPPPANPEGVFGIGRTPTLIPVVGLFAAAIALAAWMAATRRREEPAS